MIPRLLRLSGTEVYNHTPDKNFLMIGERTNVAGSPRFRKLIQNNDLEAALEVARQQVETGGELRDVEPVARSLRAGDEVVVATGGRQWHYVAVRGGVDVAPVLGSRSTDTLSGIGPSPVAVSDRYPAGAEQGMIEHVSMEIDETGGHEAARRVDDLIPLLREPAVQHPVFEQQIPAPGISRHRVDDLSAHYSHPAHACRSPTPND